MRKLSFAKIIFYLACGCVLLPWFTWDAHMMAYCWGFDFILELAIPLFIIALFLYSESGSKLLLILTELSALLLVVFTILAVGTWQNSFYMLTGWNFDLEPILPTYWISLTVFILLFIAVQFHILKKKNKHFYKEF